MKFCLIHPGFVVMPHSVAEELSLPMGPAYLAATLRGEGVDVTLVDAVGEGMNNLVPIPEIPRAVMVGLDHDEVTRRIPPDVEAIGVSCMFSVNWIANRTLLRHIAEAFPNVPLIIGGEHATALAEYCLREVPEIDFVVKGEGEAITLDLLRALDRGEDPTDIQGLAFLRDGSFVDNGMRPRERDLERYPWPAWDLIPMENYLEEMGAHCLDTGRAMPILTSRGCPYACTFCSNPMMWTRLWRARDPADVVKEIEHYVALYKVEHIDFLDMTTVVNRRWIVTICSLLIEKKLGITWQLTTTRSEAIDDEVCDLLKRSNCLYVVYAPESGSEERLRSIKKGVDKEKMLLSMRSALKAGLGVKVSFMSGFPDDDWSHVWANIWLSMRVAWVGAHDASFFPFQAYPGSELFEELRRTGEVVVGEDYLRQLLIHEYGFMTSWSRRFDARALRMICLFSIGSFYAASFLLRPARLFRLVRDLWVGHGRTKLSAGLLRLKRQARNTPVQGSPNPIEASPPPRSGAAPAKGWKT